MAKLIEFDTEHLRLRQWCAAGREPFAALNADLKVMEFFPALLSRRESGAMANRCEALIVDPLYHLIYPDWNRSMQHQASMLDSVIGENWGGATSILDVSCGIGTQSLGLSDLGYRVTASDLSIEELERAKQEAAIRKLSVEFSVADMRQAFNHHKQQFDVVISCDNCVPHLLSDQDILNAFQQFYECIHPGGGCIITVRDYEKEDLSKPQLKSYCIREENGIHWLLWQVWDPHPPLYDVTIYFAEDRGEQECYAHSFRSTYYAVAVPSLMELMQQAGFDDVRRLDGRFFQPMIVGTKRNNQ